MLLSLPVELLIQVFQWLGKKELMSLRLTCHALDPCARQHLFRHFTLYPHTQSCEKLGKISKSALLAPLLELLTFNTILEGISAYLSRLANIESVARMSAADLNVSDHDIEQAQRCLRAIVTGSLVPYNEMDKFKILTTLHEAFPNFIRLKRIQVLEIEDRRTGNLCRNIPRFYRRALQKGLSGTWYERLLRSQPHLVDPVYRYSYTFDILRAAQSLPRPLSSFEVTGTSMPLILRFSSRRNLFGHSNALSQTISGLKSLSMHSGDDTRFDTELTENLQNMLRQCTNLEHLSLKFREPFNFPLVSQTMEDHVTGETYESMFHTATTKVPSYLIRSDKLRSLSLSGLVSSERELVMLLSRANRKDNLKSLKLSHLLLLPELPEKNEGEEWDGKHAIENPQLRACLVRIIEWISQNLKLDKVALGGYWSNGGTRTGVLVPKLLPNVLSQHQEHRSNVQDKSMDLPRTALYPELSKNKYTITYCTVASVHSVTSSFHPAGTTLGSHVHKPTCQRCSRTHRITATVVGKSNTKMTQMRNSKRPRCLPL